jgi:hypothetical protein
MPRRECLGCRRLTRHGTRCESCEFVFRGGTTADRGYHGDHDIWREAWRPFVEAGLILCRTCQQPLDPADDWDMGHDKHDRTKPALPECWPCNRP